MSCREFPIFARWRGRFRRDSKSVYHEDTEARRKSSSQVRAFDYCLNFMPVTNSLTWYSPCLCASVVK
jgi:hypothetical protein